jgi:hypothetical protein
MQITKRKIKKIILFLVFMFLAGPLILSQNTPSVQAESLWEKQVGVQQEIGPAFSQSPDGTPQDIRVTIAKIIKVFLGLLGLIFLIMIIWAGFKWMTAGGNEDQVKESRDQMLRAVIGLAIILASWGITQFVSECFLTATGAIDSIWYCPSI